MKNVSSALFNLFADWVLAGGLGEESPNCATWGDAPNSRERRGMRAVKEGASRYSQVDDEQLSAFIDATGTQTEKVEGHSDRTGGYTMLGLAGHLSRQRARWAEGMARSRGHDVVVLEDGSTHDDLPVDYRGRYWVGRWDTHSLTTSSEEKTV